MMKPQILINTITDWNEPPRARHQFTMAMAKRFPVVFIASNKVGLKKLTFSSPAENIILVEPYFPVYFKLRYRIPVINELYQAWLYAELARIYENITVVNFDYTATLVSKYFDNTIYYCNDEFVGISKYNSKLIDNYFLKCEKKVIQKSRFCIATSRYLTEKLKKINANTYEIPLGVSDACLDNETLIIKPKTKKIIIGLLGVISKRQISVDLINKLINCDKFQLVLIGPIEKSFLRKLIRIEKVHMTGTLKGRELVAELSKIDVGLALYNLKKINRGATPNKLWQYLSLGKPVVVSNMPNLQGTEFPAKSVYTLYNEDEVIDTILKASNEDTIALRSERIDFAKHNTWDNRVDRFFEIYFSHFQATLIKTAV